MLAVLPGTRGAGSVAALGLAVALAVASAPVPSAREPRLRSQGFGPGATRDGQDGNVIARTENPAAAAVQAAEKALAERDRELALLHARAALAALVAEPDAARDGAWRRLGQLAGLVAWRCDDARLAADAWQAVLEARLRDEAHDSAAVLSERANLATARMRLGEFAAAQTQAEAVLDVRERTLPPDHPDRIASQVLLAQILSKLGEAQTARALQEAVLASRLRTVGPDHLDTAAARAALALTLKVLGELEAARGLEESVLATRLSLLPPEHLDVLAARQNLGATAATLGDFVGARRHFEAVLDGRLEVLPPDHFEVLAARTNLATIRLRTGDLAGARELQEQVLLASLRTLPPDHPHLTAARVNLAVTLDGQGDLLVARSLLETALETQERTLRPDHPDLQRTRASLAATRARLGDALGARTLLESSLAALERTLPESHPDLLVLRLNLAVALHREGRFVAARELLESILEHGERTWPEDHPEILRARRTLGATRSSQGDLEGACRILAETVRTLERTRPNTDELLISAREALSEALHARGDLEAALALREIILAARAATLEPDHGRVQSSAEFVALLRLQRLSLRVVRGEDAALVAQSEERAAAIDLVRAAVRSRARAAAEIRRVSSGREAEARCESLAGTLHLGISVALGYDGMGPVRDLAPDAFQLSEATRNAALACRGPDLAGDPRLASARDRLRETSAALAQLVQRGTSGDEYLQAFSARERAERAFAMAAREAGVRPSDREVDAASLGARLGKGEVAVAYRRTTRYRVAWPDGAGTPGSAPKHASEERMCAFVLQSGSNPLNRSETRVSLLDLGPLSAIEAAISAWMAAVEADPRRGLESGAADADATTRLGREVARLVLDPVIARDPTLQRLVVVPDDVLHLVPFDACPLAEGSVGGEPVLAGDRFRVEVRATLRERLNPPPAPASSNTLVALGGASFNRPPEGLEVGESREQNELTPDAGSRGGPARFDRAFEPLPFSAEEAHGLAALYTEVVGGRATAVALEKRRASRSALEALAPGARWLHVATHGWTTPATTLSWGDGPRAGADDLHPSRLEGAETLRGLSPMLLCGLALAGANLPADDAGRAPGLLTAEELAAVDLSGCELVVLSACETARGDVRRAGQGVASLQKAVQIAGARSVVTSLWKVPDQATKELMLDFYRRVWVERVPKAQALWDAKCRLREAVDASGARRFGLRDWGAWVLTGEPD